MPCASPRLDRNKGNGYNCPCICARRCILLYSSWLEHGNVVVALIDFRFHWSTVRGIGGQVSRVCYQSFTGAIYIYVICDIGREYDISIRVEISGEPLCPLILLVQTSGLALVCYKMNNHHQKHPTTKWKTMVQGHQHRFATKCHAPGLYF